METLDKSFELFTQLSTEKQAQVIAFMRFLATYPAVETARSSPTSARPPKLRSGLWKGKVQMSPDFDEPLEEFEAYS